MRSRIVHGKIIVAVLGVALACGCDEWWGPTPVWSVPRDTLTRASTTTTPVHRDERA
jgi:hypothetical protein